MAYAIAANPQGYHAFLVVVKLGERFTKECQLTINVLKEIFGANFLKTFGVLVVSNGDNFTEEKSESFETWCSKQKSFFHDLLLECDCRAVLFDNKTKDEKKKDQQLNKLLDIVRTPNGDGLRYTYTYFQFAQDEKAKLVQAWELELCEKTLKEASLIIQSLGKFDTVDQENIHSLQKLQSRAEDLLSNVVQYDRGTVALSRLIAYVQVMKKMIQEYISRIGHAQEIQGDMDQLQAQSLSENVYEPIIYTINDNIPTNTEIIPMEIEVNQEIDTEQEHSLTGTKMAELNIYMNVTYTKLKNDHIEVTRKTVAEYLMLIGDKVFKHVTNNFSFKNII
ncbi:protein AIG1 [Biomphalaria glabrata]|nr:protein AIG1 [Biomphalaria glabrata]